MDELPAGVTVMDETFFAAQRRHRRTARLYTVLAASGAVLQGIPLAIILSPVYLGLAVLVTDVVNLWVPAPNIAAGIGDVVRAFDSTDGSGTRVTETGAVERVPVTGQGPADTPDPILTVLALVVPGLVAMLLLWWLVRRFLIRDGLGGILIAAGARPADRRDDEEHQLVNVVEEISIAARIQPPRVLVLPASVPNAAAFGRSPTTWTIAVSRGLLDDLDRDATQGVVAHLVGSVGNGDLRMQHSLLALYVAHQLAQDLATLPFAGQSRRRVRLAVRLMRGKASPEEEADILRRLLTEADEDTNNFVLNLNFITFKIAQFYTNIFVVGGILTLPFRIRRYLADATAVELTRNPDGLGRALVHLQDHRSNLPGAAFAAIYTVASAGSPGGSEDSVENALVLPASLHPPLPKRVDRLHRLGFRRPQRQGSAPGRRGGTVGRNWLAPVRWLVAIPVYALLTAIGVPLAVMIFALVLVGIFMSVFLGFLFWAAVTGVVVGPLHAVLRGMA